MTEVHKTAIVEDGAKIGANVKIGPLCLVGPQAEVGDNCVLESHVVISGRTVLGPDNHLFPFTSIGHAPQDLKYQGEASELHIGKNNVLREHVTMNPGTEHGGLITRVGDNCLFMAGSHVAHDCQVGNNVILANNATLAGHVHVADRAILGGLSAVHQWARIGEGSFIGGMSGVENDVIPFGMVMGNRAHLAGLNLVGLKRSGMERDSIHNLRNAFKKLFDDEVPLQTSVEQVAEEYAADASVMKVVEFIREASDRRLCVPSRGG